MLSFQKFLATLDSLKTCFTPASFILYTKFFFLYPKCSTLHFFWANHSYHPFLQVTNNSKSCCSASLCISNICILVFELSADWVLLCMHSCHYPSTLKNSVRPHFCWSDFCGTSSWPIFLHTYFQFFIWLQNYIEPKIFQIFYHTFMQHTIKSFS